MLEPYLRSLRLLCDWRAEAMVSDLARLYDYRAGSRPQIQRSLFGS